MAYDASALSIAVSSETIATTSAEKVNAVAILNAEKRDYFTLFGIYQQKAKNR